MITGSVGSDPSNLSSAVEELIKNHVESTTLSLGNEAVESLKKLNIEMSGMKEKIADLIEVLISSYKNQRLEWAISNYKLVLSSMRRRLLIQYDESLIFNMLVDFRNGVGYNLGVSRSEVQNEDVRDNFKELVETLILLLMEKSF